MPIFSPLRDDHECDYKFKVVLVGECGVGKTCIANTLKKEPFIDDYIVTIGVDFVAKTFRVNKKKVKLHVWDTAGQERFKTVTHSYYRMANGIVLVYDITDKSSFTALSEWFQEIRKHTSSNVPVLLLGNKSDLEKERQVSKTEALNFSKRYPQILTSDEISAKHNENIEYALHKLATTIVKITDGQEMTRSFLRNQSMEYDNNLKEEQRSCCAIL